MYEFMDTELYDESYTCLLSELTPGTKMFVDKDPGPALEQVQRCWRDNDPGPVLEQVQRCWMDKDSGPALEQV